MEFIKQNKKKVIILSIIFLLILFLIIFSLFFNKTINIGNNSSEEIIWDMENISSYEAFVTITIYSNKNTNTYKLNQKYVNPNYYYQEVVEPSNIQGIITEFDGTNLKISNTRLNTSKVLQDYKYVADNCLVLENFMKDYQVSEDSKIEETETEIILKTKSTNKTNKYMEIKILHIDRKTKKPTQMIIRDVNGNDKVYILYNEIKIM